MYVHTVQCTYLYLYFGGIYFFLFLMHLVIQIDNRLRLSREGVESYGGGGRFLL